MLENKGNGDGQPVLLLSEISFGKQASRIVVFLKTACICFMNMMISWEEIIIAHQIILLQFVKGMSKIFLLEFLTLSET